MSRDRGPVLKRARALGIEPQYLGVNKKSKRHDSVPQPVRQGFEEKRRSR